MTRSISEMLSSFTTDLARTARFDVVIHLPNGLIDNPLGGNGLSTSDSQILSLRCEAAEFPSRSFATAEQKFGSNPIEKYPYQTIYNDINLTFIVSGDMKEKKIFDSWMNIIMPTYNFNPQYKYTGFNPNYTTPIYIAQYDVTGQERYHVTLQDAYPISVNQLDLDWSSDGYHKLTVTFAYTYFS